MRLDVSEQIIYGSARIGAYKPQRNQTVPPATPVPVPVRGRIMPILAGQLTLGYKSYELSNHLGNVLTTISDNKMMVQTTSSTGTVLEVYLQAVVLTTQDYYPFGKGMSERSYVNVDRNAQRYGFNGKENDEEWGGTVQDYGFRIYNPELCKFVSVDPLTKGYPMLTPYQFASNSPILCIDIDGLEGTPYKVKSGETVFSITTKYKMDALKFRQINGLMKKDENGKLPQPKEGDIVTVYPVPVAPITPPVAKPVVDTPTEQQTVVKYSEFVTPEFSCRGLCPHKPLH